MNAGGKLKKLPRMFKEGDAKPSEVISAVKLRFDKGYLKEISEKRESDSERGDKGA